MNKVQTVSLVIVLICALVALGAMAIWAPPCQESLQLANGNMVPMKCRWTTHVGELISVILAISVIVSLVLRRKYHPAIPVILLLISLSLVVITFAGPLGIGVCTSEGMACASTALWMRACGGIAVIANFAALLTASNRKHVVEY